MRLDYKKKEVLSPEEIDQKEVSFVVEEAKLQLKSDILATQRELENKRALLAEAKTTYPLNTGHIISLMDTIEGLEKGIKGLESLKEEFGF